MNDLNISRIMPPLYYNSQVNVRPMKTNSNIFFYIKVVRADFFIKKNIDKSKCMKIELVNL